MKRPPGAAPCTNVASLTLLSLLITMAAWGVLHAQAPDTYRHYQPHDSVFRITGTNIGNWDVFRALGLDYVREYNPVGEKHFQNIINSTETDTYWTERRRFFRNLLDSGKIIVPVEGMGVNLKMTRVLENYPYANDTLYHNQNLGAVISPDRGDSAMHGLIYAVNAPGSSRVRRDTLVAGGPRYLSRYLLFYSDTATYRKIGMADRSTFFWVSATFRADSLNLPSNPIAPNEIITYFIVYKRTRQNQDSTQCKCQAYVPFDTMYVTRAMYDTMKVVDIENGYKQAGTTLDLARGYTVMKYDSQCVQIRHYTEGGIEREDTTELFHRYFYDRDTIVGTRLNERVTRTVQQIDPERRREMTVRTDSIRLLHVPLGAHTPLDYIDGDKWQWFGWATCSLEECERRARAGEFGPGAIIDHEAYESDLNIRFYSTQRAPVTFLRTRVNQDLYDQLRAGKLDAPIIEPAVRKFIANDTLSRMVGRLAYSDETFFHKYRSDGETARRLQDFLHKHGDTTRQLWFNPIENYYGARVLEEDLDTTRLRTLHLICRQDYAGQVGSVDDGIPVFYANPDRMGSYALDTAYRPIVIDNETGRADTFNMIVGHSDSAYSRYNHERQTRLGSIAESRTTGATGQGALITTLTRAVDAAKFRYRQFGPAVQVWNTIQPMAWREVKDPSKVPLATGAVFPPWSSRPPTAEEVTVQAWLSLNCGVDGIVYTDCQINAENWGFVDEVVGKPRFEYGSWWPAKNFENRSREDSIKFAQPEMWTGFVSRYNAVERMNAEIRLLDSIVHLSDWVFEQKMFEPFDTTLHFADMPLLDTLIAERAERTVTTSAGKYLFTPSGVMEPRRETFMEISHFTASPRDRFQSAQYLLITNRRCWPVDTTTYGEKARSYGADEKGLGAIDVRRPWVRLKTPAFEVMADSMLVEKVGHEADWPARKVAAGDLLALDWIEPGWGAVYRITPAASGVSQYGTAWNNAVHSENPSNDGTERPRVMVFERDSAVYMRAMEPSGEWTREWLISDPRDTVTITMKDPVTGTDVRRRRGHNIFPAFAAKRGNEATQGSAVTGMGGMAVWEHRDSLNRASVELLYMNELPSRTGQWWTADTSHRRLSAPRALVPAWKQLIPAIVAVEDRGFVVAWGSPDSIGIELIGVREHPGLRRIPQGDLDKYDTTTTARIYTKVQRTTANGLQWWPADTMCQFPTLAYRRNWTTVDRTGGTKAGTTSPGGAVPVPGNPTGGNPGAPADTSSYNLVHLAYQQGYRTNEKWEIMYNLIAVDFPIVNNSVDTVPRLWFSKGEHVSNAVTACEHVHPSIAADSGYVAVAWESHLGTSTISLRFRDSIVPDPRTITVPIERPRAFWKTPYYRWGDANPVARANRWTMLRNYTTPSLTHYPALHTSQLRILPEGAMVWQWTNAPRGRRNRQTFYRYGDGGIDTTLEDGADPTMMLRPNAVASRARAFTTSSIFRRGSQAEKVTGRSPAGATAFYYPGTVVNTPLYPSTTFSRPQPSGTAIVGTYSIIKKTDQLFSPCTAPAAGGIHAGIVIRPTPPTTRRDDDSTPITRSLAPSTDWGLPPTFFGADPATTGSVTTLEAAAQIARTSDFKAGTTPVVVHRIIEGGDELLPWLNAGGGVTAGGTSGGAAANIVYRTELVRASDGAVLWGSDTISARRVGAGIVEHDVNVPVQAWATPGTAVYIRLAAYVTPGLAYDVAAGFEFTEREAYGQGAYKQAQPEEQSSGDTGAVIAVALVPNPVRVDEAEIHVDLPEAGRARIAVYDMLGNRVLVLDDLEAGHAGAYAVPVNVAGLRNGLYVVEVLMNGQRGTTRFTVMR